MTLFAFDKVTKSFPIYKGLFRRKTSEVIALRDASFELQKGKVLAIVGESGSGKTTLGRLASKLISPTSGKITFKGEDISLMDASKMELFRKSVQMIFQDSSTSLNPRHTILDAIGNPLIFHKMAQNEIEKKELVAAVLKDVGLREDAMYRYPHQFSGGQQQRLSIARAVALKPEVIICDEVISALDVSVQAQILNLLAKLQEELLLSYVFISHDLLSTRHFSDEVIVMHQGIIVERGVSSMVFQNPQDPYTQKLLSNC